MPILKNNFVRWESLYFDHNSSHKKNTIDIYLYVKLLFIWNKYIQETND